MWRSYLDSGFGLDAAAAAVVRRVVGVFMHLVQEPEKKLQSVVLRVAPELRAILGNYTLRRGKKMSFRMEIGL